MKQSILTRLTNWLGQNIIGETSEIERRSGVKLRPDFYWPRGSIILPKATNIELVQRLAENEVRRRMSRATVLFCMAISLPVAYINSYGLPAAIIGLKTFGKDLTFNTKNLTNFSMSCLFGKEDKDSLIACQRSLREKTSVAEKRIENALEDKSKMDTAYQLVNIWRQREAAIGSGATPEVLERYKLAESSFEQKLTESEISELASVYKETSKYNKDLRVIDAKLKADYYKTKAAESGLTEEENAAYKAQIEIIKNEGGKQ